MAVGELLAPTAQATASQSRNTRTSTPSRSLSALASRNALYGRSADDEDVHRRILARAALAGIGTDP